MRPWTVCSWQPIRLLHPGSGWQMDAFLLKKIIAIIPQLNTDNSRRNKYTYISLTHYSMQSLKLVRAERRRNGCLTWSFVGAGIFVLAAVCGFVTFGRFGGHSEAVAHANRHRWRQINSRPDTPLSKPPPPPPPSSSLSSSSSSAPVVQSTLPPNTSNSAPDGPNPYRISKQTRATFAAAAQTQPFISLTYANKVAGRLCDMIVTHIHQVWAGPYLPTVSIPFLL